MALVRSKSKMTARDRTGRPDYWLSISIILLILVGLVTISSASAVLSRTNNLPDNFYFFSQAKSAFLGLIFLYIGYRIDYNFWKKISPILLGINIILLLAVFIPGIGINLNGANRWINLGFTTFQPSEAIKLTLILYLAAWLEKKGNEVTDIKKSVAPFVILVVIIIGLLMKQPDMGTSTVLLSIAGLMYFVSGANYIHIAGMISLGAAGIWLLIKTEPYRMQRFTIFLNPSSDNSGTGYQINQALMAVGSGGLLGLGFGKSRQKFNYLPESSTDSIFAVICEELGMLRAGLIVTLYILFAYRGYTVAKNAPDTFSRLVAVGITTWITAQAFINIFAILSLMPLTGVPLPFISYGGSAIIMLMFSCGILLNISKHNRGDGKCA